MVHRLTKSDENVEDVSVVVQHSATLHVGIELRLRFRVLQTTARNQSNEKQQQNGKLFDSRLNKNSTIVIGFEKILLRLSVCITLLLDCWYLPGPGKNPLLAHRDGLGEPV